MDNKEKYEGKTVQIYAPYSGRPLHKIIVKEVIKNTHLFGTIVGTDVDTAYCLTDGVEVEVLD